MFTKVWFFGYYLPDSDRVPFEGDFDLVLNSNAN